MKAKEYYEKYKAALTSGDGKEEAKALHALNIELYEDAKALANTRGAKTDEAFVSCLKEANDKWNAIANIGPELRLVRDGFKKMCLMAAPQIKQYWK